MIDKIEVVDLLTHLIARSLVVADTNDTGTRYRLLETTRAYALDRLKEAGDGDQLRARHLDYYLALAEAANPKLRADQPGKWLTRLDLERENFLAAHTWCGRMDGAAESVCGWFPH